MTPEEKRAQVPVSRDSGKKCKINSSASLSVVGAIILLSRKARLCFSSARPRTCPRSGSRRETMSALSRQPAGVQEEDDDAVFNTLVLFFISWRYFPCSGRLRNFGIFYAYLAIRRIFSSDHHDYSISTDRLYYWKLDLHIFWCIAKIFYLNQWSFFLSTLVVFTHISACRNKKKNKKQPERDQKLDSLAKRKPICVSRTAMVYIHLQTGLRFTTDCHRNPSKGTPTFWFINAFLLTADLVFQSLLFWSCLLTFLLLNIFNSLYKQSLKHSSKKSWQIEITSFEKKWIIVGSAYYRIKWHSSFTDTIQDEKIT